MQNQIARRWIADAMIRPRWPYELIASWNFRRLLPRAGRRAAAKLLSKDEAPRIAAKIAKLPELLRAKAKYTQRFWMNEEICAVLMRDYALTGRHTEQLRQGSIVRANNFFIDDAGQLHCNCDQRTHLSIVRPKLCRSPHRLVP